MAVIGGGGEMSKIIGIACGIAGCGISGISSGHLGLTLLCRAHQASLLDVIVVRSTASADVSGISVAKKHFAAPRIVRRFAGGGGRASARIT